MSRTVASALALAGLGAITGCGDASGCSDFDPKSAALGVGRSTSVEMEVTEEGRWPTLDVAGYLWTTDEPLPSGVEPGSTVRGEATRAAEDAVEVEVHGDTISYTGPIGCE